MRALRKNGPHVKKSLMLPQRRTSASCLLGDGGKPMIPSSYNIPSLLTLTETQADSIPCRLLSHKVTDINLRVAMILSSFLIRADENPGNEDIISNILFNVEEALPIRDGYVTGMF
jgi:hypothetical protein